MIETAAVLVFSEKFTVTRNDDDTEIVLDNIDIFVTNNTAFLHFHAGLGGDMESTKGKLCTGFPDRLGRHDADSLSYLDNFTVCKVASVTFDAYPPVRFARENRPDHDLLYSRILDGLRDIVCDIFTLTTDEFVRNRMIDVLLEKPSSNTIGETLNDFLTLFKRLDLETAHRAAILFGNDKILGNIDKTAGKISRIGRLERRISKTLARAVC